MAPYESMLRSTAYERMRAEHPAEFAPASVFFTHDERSAIDRRNSFRVKAALVYEAITGRHVDDHMLRANRLLLAVTSACHSAISQQKHHTEVMIEEPGSDDYQKASTGRVEEEPELIDQVWDEEHKQMVDGIFLVVGFLPRLMDAIGRSADRDGVEESFKSRHMHDIVTDVIKLENQLPLHDLLDVAGVIEGVINSTMAREEFKDVKASIGGGEYKLPFTTDSFGDVVHGFCWYYSPFSSKKAAFEGVVVTDDDVMAARTLLDCLHQSVAPAPCRGAVAAGGPARMPSARELKRSGIRVQASETSRAEIEFTEQSATLRLPALVYDFKLATVARNLLARESAEHDKPLTRYFQVMNELVVDVVDVRILRRAGVVRGRSVGGQEVYELIKNMDGHVHGHATYPSAMDQEIEKVKQHYDKRMSNFFVRNRPDLRALFCSACYAN